MLPPKHSLIHAVPAAVTLLLLLLCSGCSSSMRDKETSYDLSTERIRKDTEYLCDTIGVRTAGTAGETAACDWIFETLQSSGFSPESGPASPSGIPTLRRVSFDGFRGTKSENVIAVCNPGSDGPLFSITAHYDSVETSPGARDNGASVAVLLEIARFLGPENPDFPCEIRMVFPGSEENGYHGSSAYVSSLSEEEKSRHLGAFNMDISAASPEDQAVLVCYTLGKMQDGVYQEGNFLEPVQGLVASSVAQACKTLYGWGIGGIFHVGESDHVSFHNMGLEAVNVCWRRIDHGTPRLPESYHRQNDTPAGLDYDTARASGRCILEAIHTLSAARQAGQQ